MSESSTRLQPEDRADTCDVDRAESACASSALHAPMNAGMSDKAVGSCALVPADLTNPCPGPALERGGATEPEAGAAEAPAARLQSHSCGEGEGSAVEMRHCSFPLLQPSKHSGGTWMRLQAKQDRERSSAASACLIHPSQPMSARTRHLQPHALRQQSSRAAAEKQQNSRTAASSAAPSAETKPAGVADGAGAAQRRILRVRRQAPAWGCHRGRGTLPPPLSSFRGCRRSQFLVPFLFPVLPTQRWAGNGVAPTVIRTSYVRRFFGLVRGEWSP